jgi:hypothetical protein
MDDTTELLGQRDEEALSFDNSDTSLEAAAGEIVQSR